MRILITGHQSLANRGCEALLRSTVALIRREHPQARFAVPSLNPQADSAQWPQAAEWGVRWLTAPAPSLTLRLWARACTWSPDLAAAEWPLPRLDDAHEAELQRCDLVLSIGGDNYTLDYDLASLALYVGVAERARRRGVPVALWGASVGPFDSHPGIRRHMARHLGQLQLITVRESLSRAVLQDLLPRLDGPHLEPVADPAFCLEPETTDLDSCWPRGSGSVVGLNLSPLILQHSSPTSRERLLSLTAAFIERLLVHERMRVLLVPHVSARNADGRTAHALPERLDDALLMDELLQRLAPSPRLSRLPAWNAAQIKHAIAHCDLFIGARTHAVIAALSSGVPAVALSYSLKSRGIHRDLLGNEDGVMPASDLSAETLLQAFWDLQARQTAQRDLLRARLPRWRLRAQRGVQAIESAMARAPA